MDTGVIHTLLNHPEKVHEDHLPLIDEFLKAYPWFQAARGLKLKLLHDLNSALYNQELKITAAHTVDRSILFDFITSETFIQNRISQQIKDQQQELENIEVISQTIELRQEDFNESMNHDAVTDDDLFKKPSLTEKVIPFTTSESHSFNEWLQLTKLQPIDRNDGSEKDEENTIKNNEASLKPKTVLDKVDLFLNSKPKRTTPVVTSSKNINLAKGNPSHNQLMTETLAQVYLAQKNFKKAIKAYEILKLHHPEKSGFFADRIREIKQLQK